MDRHAAYAFDDSTATRAAVEAAVRYLESRRCRNGGYCFYRTDSLEEPNLHDTYHAVSALCLAGPSVADVHKTLQYLESSPLDSWEHVYCRVFALHAIGENPAARPDLVRRIGEWTISAPGTSKTPLSAWLRATCCLLELKDVVGLTVRHDALTRWVSGAARGGAYGDEPNLRDTRNALAILHRLGAKVLAEETWAFLRRLQKGEAGFTLTEQGSATDLDTVQAGLDCCVLLGIPVEHAKSVRRFVLACQGGRGGFGRVPGATPDIEQTRLALEILRHDAMRGL